jgi:hypothetical protein
MLKVLWKNWSVELFVRTILKTFTRMNKIAHTQRARARERENLFTSVCLKNLEEYLPKTVTVISEGRILGEF